MSSKLNVSVFVSKENAILNASNEYGVSNVYIESLDGWNTVDRESLAEMNEPIHVTSATVESLLDACRKYNDKKRAEIKKRDDIIICLQYDVDKHGVITAVCEHYDVYFDGTCEYCGYSENYKQYRYRYNLPKELKKYDDKIKIANENNKRAAGELFKLHICRCEHKSVEKNLYFHECCTDEQRERYEYGFLGDDEYNDVINRSVFSDIIWPEYTNILDCFECCEYCDVEENKIDEMSPDLFLVFKNFERVCSASFRNGFNVNIIPYTQHVICDCCDGDVSRKFLLLKVVTNSGNYFEKRYEFYCGIENG